VFRPFQIWRHRLGSPAQDDELVLEESDPRFELTLEAARSGEVAIITAASRDTTEVCIVAHAEEYDRGSVILMEESLTEPTAWYELDLTSGARRLRKRLDVPGYDPARYRTERRAAVAADGTAIPVTLTYRADSPLDGSAPCLLYGYGAYEISNDPDFDRALPSLLDRGVVDVVALVRGGGELGRAWWQQGRLRSKPTTFSDYIAVADWPAGARGGASPRSSMALGSSAGGPRRRVAPGRGVFHAPGPLARRRCPGAVCRLRQHDARLLHSSHRQRVG
jgi:protease II